MGILKDTLHTVLYPAFQCFWDITVDKRVENLFTQFTHVQNSVAHSGPNAFTHILEIDITGFQVEPGSSGVKSPPINTYLMLI